jgi:tRNA modification GTPase
MYTPFDTIAAIATAGGPAALSIVRMSGPETAAICHQVIASGRSGPALGLTPAESHRLFYGRAVDPVTKTVIDEVMVTWMAAPRSYTTEDTAEISCHGGGIAANSVLRAVLAAGARHAEPGEFTFRALLHGRIGLIEAEAVLNVVSAQTSDGFRRALEDLHGDLGRRIAPAKAAVISVLAYLDASADFPDDEIPASNVSADIAAAIAALEDVLAGAKSGRLMAEGATIALVGRPNVGKSSLLNALLRSDRAIVTPVPGTTRDVVSEKAVIADIPVLLMDTAGLTASLDLVEQAGIERSRTAIGRASLVIVVLDGSAPLDADDRTVLEAVSQRFDLGAAGPTPAIVVANKMDLGLAFSPHSVLVALGLDVPFVPISALSGEGLEELEQVIGHVLREGVDASARPSILTARQYAELDRALLHLRQAAQALTDGYPTDLLATDVRIAARAIGNVTGESIDDAVLTEIFGRFCIGK